jgi:hypothetical protein
MIEIPTELIILWENDMSFDHYYDDDLHDEISKDDILRWNKFDEKQKQILMECGRYDYIYGYDGDFYETPIDIIWIFDDDLYEKECEIGEMLTELIEKHGLIDNNKQYTIDKINQTCCFLHLHDLIFYESVDTNNPSFPLPRYDVLPIENIKRWKLLSDGKYTQTLNWLENNIRKNKLLDLLPMNRLYG